MDYNKTWKLIEQRKRLKYNINAVSILEECLRTTVPRNEKNEKRSLKRQKKLVRIVSEQSS